ncbi:MAG: potassium channel family protein [Pseudomonadota bacterium]
MLLKSGNAWLLLLLSVNFWLVPALPSASAEDPLADWLLVVTLLVAVAVQVAASPSFRRWGLVAAIVILAAIGLGEALPNTNYVENTVFAISFAVATALYFMTMMQRLHDVTFGTVLAGACAYIFIGMFFAAIFGLLLELDPSAFSGSDAILGRYDMLYFSFASLTTLGAVDVFPVSTLAKMLTVFEAVIGLVYVASLVGVVVGAYAAKIQGQRR